MTSQDGEMGAHITQVVAWDVPSAIVGGERFRITAGIKCSSGCPLTHGHVAVYDHDGAHVATAALPGHLWPGTSGLYVAEIELHAPAGDGLYTWSVRGPQSDAGIQHAEGSVGFGVRVVNRPDCLVTVEAVDQESQAPLPGARVVMHPYQALTDVRGVATVRVGKGAYRLFVAQSRYLTFALPVDVGGDMTTRVELSAEPVLERN
jgi:hypothetical protein